MDLVCAWGIHEVPHDFLGNLLNTSTIRSEYASIRITKLCHGGGRGMGVISPVKGGGLDL